MHGNTKFLFVAVPLPTYCEDDIPTGLDLGKCKYGGPYTTEQVKDVKAFYGILKILFSMGITFCLDIVYSQCLHNYSIIVLSMTSLLMLVT